MCMYWTVFLPPLVYYLLFVTFSLFLLFCLLVRQHAGFVVDTASLNKESPGFEDKAKHFYGEITRSPVFVQSSKDSSGLCHL